MRPVKFTQMLAWLARQPDSHSMVNPLNAELNPICHLLALLGAHHIFHVSGLRVKQTRFCARKFQKYGVSINANNIIYLSETWDYFTNLKAPLCVVFSNPLLYVASKVYTDVGVARQPARFSRHS